jgi:hypothetical protein
MMHHLILSETHSGNPHSRRVSSFVNQEKTRGWWESLATRKQLARTRVYKHGRESSVNLDHARHASC